jgi:hypothetical protein
MRVGIVQGQVKKSPHPRQSGRFLYSSKGKDLIGGEADAGDDLAAVSYPPETSPIAVR